MNKSAKAGFAEAMWWLGGIYERGKGVPKDENEAIKWYKKAYVAFEVNGTAWHRFYASLSSYSLSKIYENQGVYDQFAEWYKKWAASSEEGLGWIVRLYKSGENAKAFPQSDVEATKWCRIGAENGVPRFQSMLGGFYEEGKGVPQDHAEAVKWSRKAGASLALGRCYENGIGILQDYGEAMRCYSKAAEQGSGRAYVRLTNLLKGYLTRDDEDIVALYQESAEQGDATAQCCLGCCFDDGIGVPRDDTKRIMWYRRAAEQGHVIAQLNLGWLLHVFYRESWREAIRWYRQAAEQGNAQAQYRLGYKYAEDQRSIQGSLEGRHFVPTDDVEAVKWYRRAAEQGNVDAQYRLGSCYRIGRGLSKDIIQAYLWIRLAAELGYTEVKDEATRLASLMSARELEDAERSYREFKDKHSAKE